MKSITLTGKAYHPRVKGKIKKFLTEKGFIFTVLGNGSAFTGFTLDDSTTSEMQDQLRTFVEGMGHGSDIQLDFLDFETLDAVTDAMNNSLSNGYWDDGQPFDATEVAQDIATFYPPLEGKDPEELVPYVEDFVKKNPDKFKK